MPNPSTGLPTGTTLGMLNFNIDTTTFRGRVWGEVTFDYGDGGFVTTFSGDISTADVPGGVLGVIKVVGRGFGSFEGMQLRATVTEAVMTGSGTFEGSLFAPGDR